MYQLPALPYQYQDLEPFIDTHTIGIHYHKHHKNYLNQLNNLLKKNNYDYRYNLTELVNHIKEFSVDDREDILFNLGGIINHNLYWKSMNPKQKNKPTGKFKKKLETKYGSYENFWEAFKNKALKLKGSGYTFLVLKKDGELDIINMSNQETPLSIHYLPLFVVDMWEHAYYLNYKNEKLKYLDNFEQVADFTNASIIFNNAVK